MINQIKLTGLIEVDTEIDPKKDYSIALEIVGCKDSSFSSYINSNDEEVKTWKMTNKGRVNILTEEDGKPVLIKGKGKKVTKSQILRLKIETSGLDYDKTMNTIIDNWEKLTK